MSSLSPTMRGPVKEGVAPRFLTGAMRQIFMASSKSKQEFENGFVTRDAVNHSPIREYLKLQAECHTPSGPPKY